MNNSNSTIGSAASAASAASGSADLHKVSRDASVGAGSSLSSLQSESSNALSNDDALHSNAGTCSDDARIGQASSDDALSSVVDTDTIMNDSELLEFDFDNEIQPLSLNQQASMARDIKMLQKRLFDATRVSLTMPDDSTLASNAGSLKRQLIMAKENYQLLFGDVVQVGSSASGIVPSDTPYIQWKGHKFNTKKYIFPTMKACFEQFEDVLESRNINIETDWKRIIKPKMSTGMASWTKDLIREYPAISWGQFKSKVKAKYCSSEALERKAALTKLKALKLDTCENLEDYIDQFNSLKQLAGVKENATLIDYFLRGLDIDLYTSVSSAISQARGTKGSDTLDFAISQLRNDYDLFRRDEYYIQEKKRKEEELNDKIKKAIRAYQRGEDSASGSKSHRKKTRRAGRAHEKKPYQSNKDGEVLKCFD